MVKRTTTQILKQLICLAMVAIVLAPIILVLFASFKTKADMVRICLLYTSEPDRPCGAGGPERNQDHDPLL